MRLNKEDVRTVLEDVCNKHHISPAEVLLKGDCARLFFGDLKVVPQVELVLGIEKWMDIWKENSYMISVNHSMHRRNDSDHRGRRAVTYRDVKYFDLDDVRYWRTDGKPSICYNIIGGYCIDSVLQLIIVKLLVGVNSKSGISKYCELFVSTYTQLKEESQTACDQWLGIIFSLFDTEEEAQDHIDHWIAAATNVDLDALNKLAIQLDDLLNENRRDVELPADEIVADGSNECAETIITWVSETMAMMKNAHEGRDRPPRYSPRTLGSMYAHSPKSRDFDPDELAELSLSMCEKFTRSLLLDSIPASAVSIELFIDVANEFIKGFYFSERSLNLVRCFESGKYVRDSSVDDDGYDDRDSDRYLGRSRRSRRDR